MGIFKKTKPQEIPIKPSISDSEREAERLRQLEASLDFLRDKPSAPAKKAVNTDHGATDIHNENKSAKANISGQNQQDPGCSNESETSNASSHSSTGSIISSHENSAMDTVSHKNDCANVIFPKNDDSGAVAQKNINASQISQENAATNLISPENKVTAVNNTALTPKEAEEAESARQKSIRSKYGRRMDYKTAKVSSAGSNSTSSASNKVSAIPKNVSESINGTAALKAEKAMEPNESEIAKTDLTGYANGVERQENKTEFGSSKANDNIAIAAASVNVKALSNESQNTSSSDFTRKSEPTEAKDSTKESGENDKLKETIAGITPPEPNDTITEKTVNKSIPNIKNPLPTPAKPVHREMEFDIMPLPEDMHFDLVDLTGKDFFDIN